MIQLEWSEQALRGLEQLVFSHSLPTDTRQRIENSAIPLVRFPRIGPALRELSDGSELRFLIGPWPWLIIVYLYREPEMRIVLVSIEDGRSAMATIDQHRRKTTPPL